MLPVHIAGLGWYLPERCVTNQELEARLDVSAEWIERATGVRERRYATHETSVQMGAAAAHMALEDAGLHIHDVDAIVGASTAPQQAIPCTAALLQRELEAEDGASACFDINATCLSFLVALQTVSHLVAAGVYRTVLIVSSEQCSRSLNPLEHESAVLLGDAAAAAIITHSPIGAASVLWHSHFATYSSGADLTQLVGGGTLHHPNDVATTPEMNMFHMQGPMIFKQAARLLPSFLSTFLSVLDWTAADIDAVIPHQASKHGLKLLNARLGFTAEQVVMNLEQRGNTIAASIPLALAEAFHAGRVRRGQRLLLLGTGAGLTIGAVALTL